jgi:glycosyltransferase involved in cell wall biosynthesis
MRDFWLSVSRPRHAWLDALGKRLLCGSAARVIANSNATAHHLPCPEKAVAVQNGIELEEFDPNRSGAPFRQVHDIPLDASLVGMVGRLRPWKGQDRFLRAMAHVAEAVPTAWFVLVGGTPFGVEDEYPARLLQLAGELGLGQRTVFTGQLDDVRPALAAMDVFVHPGDPEPFGLVNVEAMAMARPVVAFAHGALPEIVVDSDTGILVPPENIAALAQAVIHLLEEPARRRALGRAGRTRVEAQFTAVRMAEEVETVLRSVLR